MREKIMTDKTGKVLGKRLEIKMEAKSFIESENIKELLEFIKEFEKEGTNVPAHAAVVTGYILCCAKNGLIRKENTGRLLEIVAAIAERAERG